MILVSFDLFMFSDCPFQLKLEVSVADHELIAFAVEFVELTRIIFLSSLEFFQLLFESYFHFGCVLPVMIEQVFEMFDDILFGEIIDGISFVHVECICTVYECILLGCKVEVSCHHEFIF